MSALKQLSSIKPLQEIDTLQQTVHTLTSQTNTLSQKEQARNQDFLALYNITVETKGRLTYLDSRVDRRLQELVQNQTTTLMHLNWTIGNQFSNMELRHNRSVKDIERMVEESTKQANRTHGLLQQHIDVNAEKGMFQ